MSARAEAQAFFSARGRGAPAGATNPYLAGCAAATWWDQGRAEAQALPRLVDALRDCVEHMEHSTPQGRRAHARAVELLAEVQP